MKQYCIYFLIKDCKIAYIGMTCDLKRRLAEQGKANELSFDDKLAVEILARFTGNSRGMPIERKGFITGAKWANELRTAPVNDAIKDFCDRNAILPEDLIRVYQEFLKNAVNDAVGGKEGIIEYLYQCAQQFENHKELKFAGGVRHAAHLISINCKSVEPSPKAESQELLMGEIFQLLYDTLERGKGSINNVTSKFTITRKP